MNIALYPGSFSPAHLGHFDVVQKLCSEMDKVMIIKSNKERDGINAEQSLNVWNLYLQLLPDNVEIKLSGEKSPITECFHIIKNDPDNDYYVVFGKSEVDHVRSFAKLKWKNVHIYNAGNYGNISATNFRQALRDRNIAKIKTFLPPGVNVTEFMEKMGLNLHEIKIVPNTRIKVGDKYLFHNPHNPEDCLTLYITFVDHKNNIVRYKKQWAQHKISAEGPDKPLSELEYDIKNESRASRISEIKIVPQQRKPQVGDIWEINKEEYRITKADNDGIFVCPDLNKSNYDRQEDFNIKFHIEKWIKTGLAKFVRKANIQEPLFTKKWWNKHLIQESQEQVIKLTEEQKSTIKQFIGYAFKELKISTPLNGLTISYDNNAVKERASFAYYDPNTNKVWVYVKNRNMADVLRSIAHELVHSRQNEEGRLQQDSGNTGSEIENQANSLAGVMLRDFGKDNKGIYEIKIVPQNLSPQIGRYVYYPNSPKYYQYYRIYEYNNKEYKGQIGYWWTTSIESHAIHLIPKEELKQDIQSGKAVIVTKLPDGLNEIKIVPNTDPLSQIKKQAKEYINIIVQQMLLPKMGYEYVGMVIYLNWWKAYRLKEDNTLTEYSLMNSEIKEALYQIGNLLIANNLVKGNSVFFISKQGQLIFGQKAQNLYHKKSLDEIKIVPQIKFPKIGDTIVKKLFDDDNWDSVLKYKIIDIEEDKLVVKPFNNNKVLDIDKKYQISKEKYRDWFNDKIVKIDNSELDEIKIVPNTNRLPSVFKGSDLKMYLYKGGSSAIDPYIGVDQVINAYRIPSNNKYIYLPGIPYIKKNGDPGVYVLAFEVQYFELHRDDAVDQDQITDSTWKLIIIGKDKFTDGNEIDEIKIVPQQRKPQVGDIYEFLPETKWEGQYKIIEIEPEKRNQCTFKEVTSDRFPQRLYYDISNVVYMIKEKMIKFIKHE